MGGMKRIAEVLAEQLAAALRQRHPGRRDLETTALRLVMGQPPDFDARWIKRWLKIHREPARGGKHEISVL